MKSSLFKLNVRDLIKGCITAVIFAVLTGLYQVIQTGGDFNRETVKIIFLSGLGAGISYLLKNLFTNSNDAFLTAEPRTNPRPNPING